MLKDNQVHANVKTKTCKSSAGAFRCCIRYNFKIGSTSFGLIGSYHLTAQFKGHTLEKKQRPCERFLTLLYWFAAKYAFHKNAVHIRIAKGIICHHSITERWVLFQEYCWICIFLPFKTRCHAIGVLCQNFRLTPKPPTFGLQEKPKTYKKYFIIL